MASALMAKATKRPRFGAVLDEMLCEQVQLQGGGSAMVQRLLGRRLLRIALESKDEKVVLQAIRDVREYTEGRTPIRVMGAGDEESLTDLHIEVIGEADAEALAAGGPLVLPPMEPDDEGDPEG